MNRRMNLKYSLKQEDNRLRDHWQTQEKNFSEQGRDPTTFSKPTLSFNTTTHHGDEDSKLILYQAPGLEPEPRSAEEESLNTG